MFAYLQRVRQHIVTAKANIIFDRIISIFAAIAGTFIVLLLILVNSDVILRYFAGKPISWMAEIVEFFLLWITFLGTTWVLKNEAHIKMDLVISRLRPRTQEHFKIYTNILGTILCLIMTWYSAQVTWQYFRTDFKLLTYLTPPAAVIYFIIPVGFILLALQFLRAAYRAHKHLRNL
jgi:C4-dicarboxylate transporter DctQ subunit